MLIDVVPLNGSARSACWPRHRQPRRGQKCHSSTRVRLQPDRARSLLVISPPAIHLRHQPKPPKIMRRRIGIGRHGHVRKTSSPEEYYPLLSL
ncbi:hypothetical protein KCP73_26690 [Salmonella enterica subsp. enterica]|nr:hypothetical protein KCP73_26690 [Salmonella enterica subsp. enterica]